MNKIKFELTQISFVLLFFAQFTYYLLIIQTGIVDLHNSNMSELWMLPFGGVIGVFSSIIFLKYRVFLFPVVILLQLILSFFYLHLGDIELFILGLTAGVSVPILIYRITNLLHIVFSLALAYIFASYFITILPQDRTMIAVFLSGIAFLFSWSISVKLEKKNSINLSDITKIFIWLILDSILFETLSRNMDMRLWGVASFTYWIILFHMVGLVLAYIFRNYKYNNIVILTLFAMSYMFYFLELKELLVVVYPIVISYYNVIILQKFMKLSYKYLVLMATLLWLASGFGFMVALNFMI